MATSGFVLLARVRVSIRALNRAIATGSAGAGLTVQQQAFLLSLASRGGRAVPLGAVRRELGMDQATASDLLTRLARAGLVRRARGADRRSADLTLTRKGRGVLGRSVLGIRTALRAAHRSGELDALATNIAAYLRYHGIGRRGATSH